MGKLSEYIRNFSPGYGACIMGTGILAVTSSIYSTYFPELNKLALLLTILNTAIAIVVAILLAAKILLDPGRVHNELSHPVMSNFYPTLPIGLMILGMDYIVILKTVSIGLLLWSIGAIATFILGVVIPYNLFKSESVHLGHVNPSFFIPPVGLIVIPIAGSIAIKHASSPLLDALVFFNIISWGSGFFIYLALLAVCVHRFLLYKPLPSVLAPTMWINLGPIGAGSVALYNLSNAITSLTDSMTEATKLFIVLFWASGVWWFLLAILMTLHYIKRNELSYAPSWWAFTFPLGAYVAATHIVYGILSVKIFDLFGLLLYILLLLLWLAAFQGTFRKFIRAFREIT